MRKFLATCFSILFATSTFAEVPGSGVLVPIGGGGGSNGGGVTSVSTTCPSSGPSTGAVSLSPPTGRTVSGGSDTLVASDCGSLVEYQNATSTAVSLTAAATLGAKWCVNISVDTGAGTVTITSGGGNFNTTGNTTLTLAAKGGASVCTNAAATGFNVQTGATGGVTGPGSSVSGNISTFNGTSGGVIQDSGITFGGQASSTLGTISQHPGYVSTLWYGSSQFLAFGAAGAASPINDVLCHPFSVDQPGFDASAIGVNVTALSATAHVTSAIFYNNNPFLANRPGTLIDYGTIAIPSATGSLSMPLQNAHNNLKPGVYWVCTTTDNLTASPQFTAVTSNASDNVMTRIGTTTVTQALSTTSPNVSGIYCTAGTNCANGYNAWSAGAFTWNSFTASNPFLVTASGHANVPVVALQVR